MSENEIKEIRKFTAKTDGDKFDYSINTYFQFHPQDFRIEYQSSIADKIIFCFDKVTQKKEFDMKYAVNCLQKFNEAESI